MLIKIPWLNLYIVNLQPGEGLVYIPNDLQMQFHFAYIMRNGVELATRAWGIFAAYYEMAKAPQENLADALRYVASKVELNGAKNAA